MANDLQLTELQKKTILALAKADDRTLDQQLARVISTGVTYLYGATADNSIYLDDHTKTVDDLAGEIEDEMRKKLGLGEVA
jgi:predicted ABC-class ATPase